MKNFIFLICIWCILPSVRAQNIQVTSSAPKVVEIGEQFQLEINVNATPSDFQAPDLHDLKILFGPSTSQSSSIQIVNGQMAQSSSYTYTYVLQSNKIGKIPIGPATVTVKGKKYQSTPFTIETVASSAKNSQSTTNQSSASQPSNPGTSNDEEVLNEGDAFVRVILDKKSVIQGDYITASIKLYSKLGIVNVGQPVFDPDGFFKQEIQIPQIKAEVEAVNGQKFYSVLLGKYILIPQKSGDLVINPVNEECVIQRRVQSRSNGIFDDFFGPSVQNVALKLKSKSLTIKVQPLPGNKPESFKGGVGKFTLNAKLDKNSVKANEPISLKVSITGKGNIKLIEAPKIDFPPDFETYDPKISQNLSTSDGGISGTKSFEYLLIPRNAGNYNIPPLTYSYFDISTNQYKTLSTQDFAIHVEKGIGNQGSNIVTGYSKEDVKVLGKDIIFIKTAGLYSDKGRHDFFGSTFFYLIYLLVLIIFIVIIWLRRRIIRQNANLAFVKNRRADKYATKRLKQANVHLKLNETEKFYDELIKAIWGYLSDKMNIPLSDLSRDNVSIVLEKRGVDSELVQMFVNLIDNCEFARYSPSSAGISLIDDYRKAVDLITKLQQKLR